MATNFLLKLDGAGIKGESPVDGYSDYMQLICVEFWREPRPARSAPDREAVEGSSRRTISKSACGQTRQPPRSWKVCQRVVHQDREPWLRSRPGVGRPWSISRSP